MALDQHFEVELCRSLAGTRNSVRVMLVGLGLARFGRKVLLPDTVQVRGLLYKVCHWVKVTPKIGARPAGSSARQRRAEILKSRG